MKYLISFFLLLLGVSQLGCSPESFQAENRNDTRRVIIALPPGASTVVTSDANSATSNMLPQGGTLAQRIVPESAGMGRSLEKADFAESQYGIDMVYVEGGTFSQGCTQEQESECGVSENPVHDVTLSDFFIGKYEITQAQWKSVMGEDNNPSEFVGDDLPVTNVSWYDAQVFIIKLNEKTGKRYRLPTNAEWEYAARGGNQSRGYKYSGSNDINEVAWYAENSGGTTHRVGTKKANELGIFDMSGNAWEWVFDLMMAYTGSDVGYSGEAQTNPQQPEGNFPLIRGGGWNLHDKSANRPSYSSRVSFYTTNIPTWKSNRLGFRLAHSQI